MSRTSAVSVMQAMIRIEPPHLEQRSGNTSSMQANSSAQA